MSLLRVSCGFDSRRGCQKEKHGKSRVFSFARGNRKGGSKFYFTVFVACDACNILYLVLRADRDYTEIVGGNEQMRVHLLINIREKKPLKWLSGKCPVILEINKKI